jgi:hypothetical protein
MRDAKIVLDRFLLTAEDKKNRAADQFEEKWREFTFAEADGKGMALKNIPAVCGIYFFEIIIGKDSYTLYIGRSSNIIARMKMYAGKFLPRSADDSKIAFFVKLIRARYDAESKVNLFVKSIESCKDGLCQTESAMIKRYHPLINPPKGDEADRVRERKRRKDYNAENLKNAYESYFSGLLDVILELPEKQRNNLE